MIKDTLLKRGWTLLSELHSVYFKNGCLIRLENTVIIEAWESTVFYRIPVNYIEEVCPACGEIVEFTKEQLNNYDGRTHLELSCPHCKKFCCFTCQYIYSRQ